jgi:hypothetical protein
MRYKKVYNEYTRNICMKNKTFEFLKNGAISCISFMGGGIAGAELTDLITDSEVTISSISTASQYIAGYGAFIGLHARDNKELYKNNKGWNVRQLAIDTSKTVFSLGVAELVYIPSRTLMMNYFLNRDNDSTPSSLYADAICLPLFFLVALPIAKKTGLIKKIEK